TSVLTARCPWNKLLDYHPCPHTPEIAQSHPCDEATPSCRYPHRIFQYCWEEYPRGAHLQNLDRRSNKTHCHYKRTLQKRYIFRFHCFLVRFWHFRVECFVVFLFHSSNRLLTSKYDRSHHPYERRSVLKQI